MDCDWESKLSRGFCGDGVNRIFMSSGDMSLLRFLEPLSMPWSQDDISCRNNDMARAASML